MAAAMSERLYLGIDIGGTKCAVVLADGESIEASDLGLHDVGGGELASLRIDHWERKLIQEALSRSDGSVPAAAKLLGIGRATLYRKIDEYGIER